MQFNFYLSNICISMFSHFSTAHFLFNMVALWSFGGVLHQHLGREYFLAFYLTSGLSAGLVSHLYNSALRNTVMSLGASGALFGLVGLVYDRFPNAELAFFFLFPFQAKQLIPAIAAFDTVGLFGVWRNFLRLDHAAHLGGLVFGYILSRAMHDISIRRKALALRQQTIGKLNK